MKRIMAATAIVLAVGLIGIHVANAGPGWNQYYRGRGMMVDQGYGPGYGRMTTRTAETGNRQWGPGYCWNEGRGSYGRGPARMGYGYGPMHWDRYNR